MTSWKTTIAGLLTAFGLALSQVKDPAWIGHIGAAIAALGAAMTGVAARDYDKSSEDSGLK